MLLSPIHAAPLFEELHESNPAMGAVEEAEQSNAVPLVELPPGCQSSEDDSMSQYEIPLAPSHRGLQSLGRLFPEEFAHQSVGARVCGAASSGLRVGVSTIPRSLHYGVQHDAGRDRHPSSVGHCGTWANVPCANLMV